MENIQSTSGLASETVPLRPATPPYTPARSKRRLERSDSPASSIHPFETTSPAKRAAKRANHDGVKVEELTEGDIGYLTDIDVVYPEELEEVSSDSDDNATHDSDSESDSGVSHEFSKLSCDEKKDLEELEKRREERRLRKRTGSTVFKRSHSQSVKSEAELTDDNDLNDQDLNSSARRLRRRVRGPADPVKLFFEDLPRSESRSTTGSANEASASRRREQRVQMTPVQPLAQDDDMDIDDEMD